jgi:hypothetical protein
MFEDMASDARSAADDGDAAPGLAPTQDDGSAADFGLKQTQARVCETQVQTPFFASVSSAARKPADQSNSKTSKACIWFLKKIRAKFSQHFIKIHPASVTPILPLLRSL